jgi:cell division protein ZapA (FtsZ GTPase activity inhibitor)
MKDDKVTIEINKIVLDNVSLEGLNPLEAPLIASDVEAKMREIEKTTGTVDTLKLALLTAISYASDLYIKEQETQSLKQQGTKQLDDMLNKLSTILPQK